MAEHMDEESRLHVRSVFGEPERVKLFAALPPQEEDFLGRDTESQSQPEPRTYLLTLRGRSAAMLESTHHDIWSTWQSANGTTYCATQTTTLLIYRDGAFSTQQITEREGEVWRICGLSGATPDADVLVAFTKTDAFLRVGGSWRELDKPEECDMVWFAVVKAENEIYFLTDAGLALFDGRAMQLLESPEDEFKGLVVRPNGDMIATGDQGLYLWSERAGTWSCIEHEDLTVAMLDRGSEVWIGCEDGVLRWDGKQLSPVTQGFFCNSLYQAGEALYAVGAGRLHEFVGDHFEEIPLPLSLLEGGRG